MALSEYAMLYAAKKAASSYDNKLESFEFLGKAYVRMALREMMDLINSAADAFILREGVDPEKITKKEK